MGKIRNKLKAFFLALIFQVCVAGAIFFGGLLDPLVGLWTLGIYFFIVGSYLAYHYFLVIFFRNNLNS